ncbi:ABC-2 transporter permease [Geobacillus kaustophilus NBRC 102445]|uniref:ABC-2 transporter permease n=1 Tax=Geobacillus kaustophilus TaxID=1462 RepID=UPI0010BE57DA|nr:ABC-2 transporter permease [Geobacillus kaustophilus]QCK82211.1 ABC-2 transporter permease [Geobacillus kaustophilus NBRC 102445]
MFHLIKKDVLIQKRALKLSVLLMLFFTATLSSLGSIGIVVGIFAITYQLVLGASALEEKNNSDVILISLPIKRNTIVLSKYVSVYVYAAFAMAGFYLVYLMVNLLNIPLRIHLRGQLFLVALIAVTFFSCICLPLTFKYGYTKAKMPNLVIFLLFVFGENRDSQYTCGRAIKRY